MIKLKKCKLIFIIIMILALLLLVSNVNAAENATDKSISLNDNEKILTTTDNQKVEINTDANLELSENTQENNESLFKSDSQDTLGQSNTNQTCPELLSQNNNEEILSVFDPYRTSVSITINDTTDLGTTGNVTVKMHFSFETYTHNGEFTSQNINIYENNTLIKKLIIGEQNLPELKIITGAGTSAIVQYQADLLFNYTVKDNTYLTTSLFGVYSNTIQFEKIRDLITVMNTTQINVDGQYISNETWNNSINSIKKALKFVKNNGTIQLSNLNIVQDTADTLIIDKDVTISGYNATFTLKENNILFEISPDVVVTFINVTFAGNSYYIISNKGNAMLINCTFKENNLGLINNTGDLEIKNTIFHNLNHINQDRQTINKYGFITNNGILRISDVLFYNDDVLPYNLPVQSAFEGIIYNTGMLTLNNAQFRNLKDRIIYNTGELTLNNTVIKNITPVGRTGVYKSSSKQPLNNQYTYNTYSTKQIGKSMNGGAIYNTNKTNIINSTFQYITATNGGAIYNTNQLKIVDSTINGCSGIGAAIYNLNVANIDNCQIINNKGSVDTKWRYEEQSDGQTFAYVDKVYSGVIYNGENANANITKSIIKNNIIYCTSNGNWQTYYGNIKNDGILKISGCIFDNNNPVWDFFGGDGSFNIYNTGKITVMYCYLLNTKIYIGETTGSGVHSPHSFLYNTGSGTCSINYNFYCLSPSSIIRNANPNYYFNVFFDDDYYPIKFNESRNITLYLNLTDGSKIIDFDDWDKLPDGGLKTTLTLNINGTENTMDTILKNNVTIPFNNTDWKGEYVLYADIDGYLISALIDLGKEYADMNVSYNNITYNDGNNVTFNINVTGNNTPLSGNITITLNNQKYQISLINGACNFTAPNDLKPGNYTVKIEYSGNDDYFKIKNQYYTFEVNKIPTNYTLIAPEIKIGETGKLTITVMPSAAKLIAYLYVDGKMKRRFAIQNQLTLDLKNYAVGTYNLTVKFEEDEYYAGGDASTIFVVSKYETNLTVVCGDIDAGENATLNITINPGDVRGEAVLEINGVNLTIFINNTVTPITLTDLQNGTYYVTVYYPGDAKYLPSNASTTFSVSRKTSNLTVEITSNDNLTGNVIVTTIPGDCTGLVGMYINNDLYMENITNGSVNFQVKFKRGNNYIYIQYMGDSYYDFCTWNATRYIEGKAIIDANDTIIVEQESSIYAIRLVDTDGNPYEYTDISITFQNQTSTLTTNDNGFAYLPITTKAGTYNITATYKNATKTSTVTVIPSEISIDIKDILAGETETIQIRLKCNATGNITLIIDNTTYTETLTDGTASVDIPDLSLGEHTLTVIYSGDENYINQTVKTSFSIKNSLSWIRITANDTVYGENLTITATVINGATGTVTFTVNNQTQTVNLTGSHATAIFTNIPAGNTIITAHYNGDGIYQGSDAVKEINVKKASASIEIVTSELKMNENVLITALVNEDATGNVTFTIRGLYSPRNRTITNGNASWLISPLNVGSYTLVATYNGDNNYQSCEMEKLLIVNQTKTTLKVTIPTVNADDDLIVYATLTDENCEKVTDNITLEINGKYYKIVIIDGSGSRNLGEFKANTYSFTGTYLGTDILSRATSTGTAIVKANSYKITGAKNIAQYYGANKIYKIRILNNNKAVANGAVKITINKQTKTLKTNKNGYVSVKISLKPGTYTITSTYKNKKVTNKITVKTTLITANKNLKGKTIVYTAKVLNTNGKAFKNKIVTFKINSKTYKVKTASNGIAKLTIKNMKAGKYKIFTVYGKLKNTNTITLKN